MSLKRPSAPTIVLTLLCLMYLITYIARQNLATAGGDISKDLGLTNSQLGQVIGRSAIRTCCFRFSAAGSATVWAAPDAVCLRR